MSKLPMRPEMREFIIKLDNLIREGVIEPSFDFVVDGSDLITHSDSSEKVFEVFSQGENGLKIDNFDWLKDAGYMRIKPVRGNRFTFTVEQSLHDLVDRDFEIEPTSSTSVNITAQQATITITRADAITIINNNVELADALEARIRAVISGEHAFLFAAINELREAVDNTQKENAVRQIFRAAAADVNDIHGLVQVAQTIVSVILWFLAK